MKIRFLISVIILAVILCGSYGCSKKANVSNASNSFNESDVSGIWKGNQNTTDINLFNKEVSRSSGPIELVLAQTGKSIAGRITFSGGSVNIESGFIVGEVLSFTAGNLNIDAIVDGKSIEGTVKVEYRDDHGVGAVHKMTCTFKVTR